jgi:hypothetical protein
MSEAMLLYVLCIDVGSPKNIGWADNAGGLGTQAYSPHKRGHVGEQINYRRAGLELALNSAPCCDL